MFSAQKWKKKVYSSIIKRIYRFIGILISPIWCIPDIKTWTIVIQGQCSANKVNKALIFSVNMIEKLLGWCKSFRCFSKRTFCQNMTIGAHTQATRCLLKWPTHVVLNRSRRLTRIWFKSSWWGGKLGNLLISYWSSRK